MKTIWKRIWARKYAPYLSSAFIRSFLGKASLAQCPNKLFVPEGNLYALYFEQGEFNRLIRRFTEYLLKQNITSFARSYEHQFKQYHAWAKQMHRTDWRDMTKKEFINFVTLFNQRFTDFGELQLLSFVVLEGPGRLVEEQLSHHPDREAILQAIATPAKQPKIAKAHEALVRLVLNKKTSARQLEQYAKRYAWLTIYEFTDRPLRLKDVIRQVKHITNPRHELWHAQAFRRKNLQTYRRYLASITDHRFKKLVEIVHAFAYLKEMRDDYRRPAYYLQLPFWQEVARRTKLPLIYTNYLNGEEIIRVLKSDKAPLTKRIAARKKKYALHLDQGELRTTQGVAANRVAKMVAEVAIPKEIKGMASYPGQVTGTARVIYHQGEFSKFRPGEILVTTMTHPEFITIMRQAKAVITDEGGITCHAAIVSREMRIPCVIGTKNATKVLKDGDKVEVDANRGLVRKI